MENKIATNNAVDYETSNSLAAIWSMMLPGLGQLMKGRIMAGIIWAFFVAGGYFSYFWPGITLHAFCILDAALYKGHGSLLDFNTWPKRIGFVSLMIFLLGYIVFRNSY